MRAGEMCIRDSYRVDPSADWGGYNTTNNQALTAVRNIRSGTEVDYPITVRAMADSTIDKPGSHQSSEQKRYNLLL